MLSSSWARAQLEQDLNILSQAWAAWCLAGFSLFASLNRTASHLILLLKFWSLVKFINLGRSIMSFSMCKCLTFILITNKANFIIFDLKGINCFVKLRFLTYNLPLPLPSNTHPTAPSLSHPFLFPGTLQML